MKRGWHVSLAEVYALPLRERLPKIRIPLREGESDVPLDLQALVEQAYENGRYDDTDYASEPIPALDPADAAWSDELLKRAGKR